jgi:hypothetical protein
MASSKITFGLRWQRHNLTLKGIMPPSIISFLIVDKETFFRSKLLPLILFLLFLQPLACGERKQPIGVVTTTNYCQGKITASTKIVKPGDIALSRDIEKKYGLTYGDLIYVDDERDPYVFMDRMPSEWKRHVDLYTRSCKNAKEYGVRKRMIWFVRKRPRKDYLSDSENASNKMFHLQ